MDEKQAVRERVWELLEREGAARFPGARGRIPNFRGAEAAAARLAELREWREAAVIKANPDAPQLPVRRRARKDGKTLYMAVPRLAEEEPFVLVRGDPTIKRALAEGRRLALDELEPVDLIVCGTVAVNREGIRVGKGGGFSDLEFALLVERGLVGDETTIVTTIHPLQLLDEELPETAHDFRVDAIVTPDTVLRTGRSRRPPGLLRDHLDDDKRAAIPVLRDWSAMTLLALTKHNGIRIAEVGFALAAIAGAVFAFGGGRRSGELLGGLVLAVAGVLLVVAAHWGHFG